MTQTKKRKAIETVFQAIKVQSKFTECGQISVVVSDVFKDFIWKKNSTFPWLF